MSEVIQEATPEQEKAKKTPVIIGMAGGLVGSIAIGAVLGLFVVGPKLAPDVGPLLAAPQPATPIGEAPSTAPSLLYVIENLVLNPSGSNGSRFLLLSVAIGVSNEATMALLKARDPEVRDRILGLLGAKSVEEVWEADRREQLRQEVLAELKPLFPYESVRAVYFPQFVIQ